MTLTKQQIANLLSEANEPDVVDRLSSWEEEFVENVSDFFAEKGFLSDNQQEKLKEIVEGS